LSSVDAKLVIRAAGVADAAAIAHVHRESWRTTYAGMLPLAMIERETERKSEATWRHWLENADRPTATIVAEVPGAGIVGFSFCGAARTSLEGLEAEIYALYVLQEHQRHGVGRELVRESARHFVRLGLFGFYLWVLKANRARLFYEALGGQSIAEKTEQLGGHPFGEIAYAWHDLTALVAAD
jgi:ribosomal protein S18 acetylase RimI-like enzyme